MERTETTQTVEEHESLVLAPPLATLLQETAGMLKGGERQMFMTKTVVEALQFFFHWNKNLTIFLAFSAYFYFRILQYPKILSRILWPVRQG